MIYNPNTRRRKAYWVAFRVALSYIWLYLMSKLRGEAYWKSRIANKNRKNAERVRDLLLELQGLFIKVGQLISILSNVLPEEFREPLESLQDNVPADDFSVMRQVIEAELGIKVKDVFESVDTKPIAAASIGQVHRAVLQGEEVIIKIQHPEIDNLAHIDLSIIKNIIALVARFMNIKGIEHVYEQVEQMIEEELNYLKEAESMQRIKQNLALNDGFYIPKVYTNYSSKKVLVMEYCEGVKISNLQQLDSWQIDRDDLSEKLVRGYCQMIFEDGFYHADPHPGNLLVNEQGQIVLLDFGAVAQLNSEMKQGIPKLIECILKQDAEEMVVILRKLGFIGYGEDVARVAEQLIDRIQDFVYNELQLENLNVQNLTADQLRKAIALVNFKEMSQILQIPKDWVLLNRAITLVQGVTFLLSPDWNPIDAIKPYLQKQLQAESGGFAALVLNTVKNQLSAAIAIPQQLQKTLRKANKGKLEIQVQSLDVGMRGMQRIGQQLVWLVLFIASVYFYLAVGEYTYPKLHFLFQWLGIIAFLNFWWAVLRK